MSVQWKITFWFIFSCLEAVIYFFFSQLLTQDVQLAPICNCVCVSNLYCKGTKASKGEQKEIKVIYCTDRCKIEL